MDYTMDPKLVEGLEEAEKAKLARTWQNAYNMAKYQAFMFMGDLDMNDPVKVDKVHLDAKKVADERVRREIAKRQGQENFAGAPGSSSGGMTSTDKGRYAGGFDPLQTYRPGGKVNAVMNQYGAQGSSDWNTIDRLDEDIDTERYSRLADRLNNQQFYKGGISYVGENGPSVGEGSVGQLNTMETEDMRQMQSARQREAERRQWNSGIEQESAMYEQNMGLLNGVRTAINQLFNQSLLTEMIATEPDVYRKQMLQQLNKLSPDTRDMLTKLLDTYLTEKIQEFTDYGVPKQQGAWQ